VARAGLAQSAAFDQPDRFFAEAKVTPSVQMRLLIYAEMLKKWQGTVNLIANSTVSSMWQRHFADSWQVSNVVPAARIWLDLGSGAGFPGLVTAIRYAEQSDADIHLIESDRRKCAFLREVSRETKVPVKLHCGRIEDIVPTLDQHFEAVSARALAPLAKLIDYAQIVLDNGAIGVFPKGEHAAAELTGLPSPDRYSCEFVPSWTAPSSQLILVKRRC
jgi:16S rRNA (guanine527-N7)-methyltransferase